jgi:uncharacterized membrane protein YgdD (TMEM256/DUF423 family)
MAHALALGLCAVLADGSSSSLPQTAGWAFFAGTVLFSGSLYLMTLTDLRALGAVTPFGGLAFLIGWGALLTFAFKQ